MDRLTLLAIAATAALVASPAYAQSTPYAVTNLGKPPGAYSAVAVRMNNLGQVAGWSQYFGQGEPSLRGWVWTPDGGFTVLPPPPGFPNGRSRAMDINDFGVVAGDGGYDTGLAWRYENGQYTVIGNAQGLPGAYLGGINNPGDIAGTAKDGQVQTADVAWLDRDTGGLLVLTSTGRATDVNNLGQVCGYTQGPAAPFQAFRWDSPGGIQPLGTLGLAHSFATAINDSGSVVGYALSGSGNTMRAFVYTDALGMQEPPTLYPTVSAAIQINNQGHVVGTTQVSGPDIAWLWTGGSTVTDIRTLFDAAGAHMNVLGVNDINDAGQILVRVFDNNVPDYRDVILTPPLATNPHCFGDGLGAPCPCANSGVAGHGCDNSAGTGGALLTASGTTHPDTVILAVTGELSTSLTLVLQGTQSIAPLPFGDGLRCVGGTLKRLYSRTASSGALSLPGPGDLSITARSAQLNDSIAPGTSRSYMTYYRDANPAFCPTPPGSTFNGSNALTILW